MSTQPTARLLLDVEAYTFRKCCPHCAAPTAYVADYGAPGIGQSWQCRNGHMLCLIGGSWTDGPRIMSADDVR